MEPRHDVPELGMRGEVLQRVGPRCLVGRPPLRSGRLQPAGHLPDDTADAGPPHDLLPQPRDGRRVEPLRQRTVHPQRRGRFGGRVVDAHGPWGRARRGTADPRADGHAVRPLHALVHGLGHGPTGTLFAAELQSHARGRDEGVELQMVHLSAGVAPVQRFFVATGGCVGRGGGYSPPPPPGGCG